MAIILHRQVHRDFLLSQSVERRLAELKQEIVSAMAHLPQEDTQTVASDWMSDALDLSAHAASDEKRALLSTLGVKHPSTAAASVPRDAFSASSPLPAAASVPSPAPAAASVPSPAPAASSAPSPAPAASSAPSPAPALAFPASLPSKGNLKLPSNPRASASASAETTLPVSGPSVVSPDLLSLSLPVRGEAPRELVLDLQH